MTKLGRKWKKELHYNSVACSNLYITFVCMFFNPSSWVYVCLFMFFYFFSAYTICSPMVRSDGTVSVSVGVACTKEEGKKASERLVSPCIGSCM